MRTRWGSILAAVALVGLSQAPAAADAMAPRDWTRPYVTCEDGYVTIGYDGAPDGAWDWVGLYYTEHEHENPTRGLAGWYDALGIWHKAWYWSAATSKLQTGITRGTFTEAVHWKWSEGIDQYMEDGETRVGHINCE